MTDILDLEAEMAAETALAERTARARARVAKFNALPRQEQIQRLMRRPDPAPAAAAARTLRRHGEPGLHRHLQRLEGECLEHLRPADADRLRRTR